MSPKRPLRDEVKHQVLERLVRGRLPFGHRINETALAEDLGVSRTPLREALLELQREGFLHSATARGFTIRPLTAREIQEIYPILWTLESLALQSVEQAPNIEALVDYNKKLHRAKNDPEKALELDSDWHSLLISECRNERLRVMISELKRIVRRYEYTFMWDVALIERSVEQHQAVIDALSHNDGQHAEMALQMNWRTGMESLLARL